MDPSSSTSHSSEHASHERISAGPLVGHTSSEPHMMSLTAASSAESALPQSATAGPHPRTSSDAFSGRMSGRLHQLSNSLSISKIGDKIGDKLKLRHRNSIQEEHSAPSASSSIVPAATAVAARPSHGPIRPSTAGHVGHAEGVSADDIQAFDPPLQPFKNPFSLSLVTTPLTKIMTRLPRAISNAENKTRGQDVSGRFEARSGNPGSADTLHAGSEAWPEFEGSPPMGYLWLWLGNLRRWQRRFLVASDTPGVLLIYKRMNMKGKVSSISLRSALVEIDEMHDRQLHIITSSGIIFLRAMLPEDRLKWLECLRRSIAMYAQHQTVVEELSKESGHMLALANDNAEALTPQAAFGGSLSTISNPGARAATAQVVVDMDAEQRKRIRTHVADRLAEVWPFEQELEHHMTAMRQQLLSVVSGLNVHVPMMTTPSSTNLRALSSSGPAPPVLAPTHSATHEALDGAAVSAAAPLSSALLPAAGSAGGQPGPSALNPASDLAEEAGQPINRASLMGHKTSRTARPKVAVKAATFQQAHGNLLDAVRAVLQNEAVRIVQLEAENAALSHSLNVLKARLPAGVGGAVASGSRRTNRSGNGGAGAGGRSPDHSRSSGPMGQIGGESGSGAAAARHSKPLGMGEAGSGAAVPAGGKGESGGDDDNDSVQTADEDAFAVDEKSAALHDGDEDVLADDEGESSLEEEEEEAGRQQAVVLKALEVVRQVDFVSRDDSMKFFTSAVAPGGCGADAGDGTLPAPGHAAHPPAGEEEDDGDQNDSDDTVHDTEGVVRWTRSRLPAPKPLGKGFSIWSILKNVIGRDLSKITMPATINEPLSVLQRLSEVLEYRSLADRALECADSAERMVWVAAWVATFYNSQPFRAGKPFNPLLGETYEWRSQEGDCRFLGEQVSHHPPVSCIWAEGANGAWQVYGEVETRTKFWGKSIELIWHGAESLYLKPFDEEYRYNKANVCVQDVILGNYWIEVYGEVKIVNQKTGDVCKLNFKPCRGRLAERGRVDGTVCNAKGKALYRITGSTSDKLYAELTKDGADARRAAGLPVDNAPDVAADTSSPPSGAGGLAGGTSRPGPVVIGTKPVMLWEKMEYPEDPVEQYMFTKFAIGINDPAVPYASRLSPTDARFRPDQRAMELGDWASATSEKLRLEEKQRQARRNRKEAGEEWRTMWFDYQGPVGAKDLTNTADQQGYAWAFNNEYWKRQEARDWNGCADIY